VLAFAATGRCPFGEGDFPSVAFRVLYREPDLDGVPPPVRELIGSCLAKEPSQRPGLATVMDVIAGRRRDDIPAGSFWPPGFGRLLGPAAASGVAASGVAAGVTPAGGRLSSATGRRGSWRDLLRSRRWVLASLAAGIVAVAVAATLAIAAPGATSALPVPVLLGAPDFNRYCQAHGEGSAWVDSAAYGYGWRCTHATSLGDEAQATCLWTYHLPPSEVTNTLADFYDPNSWQCWRAHRQVAPPDWSGYCASKGWGMAQLTPARYAYGWHCTRSGNGLSDVAVCEWTNHAQSLVLGRFQDFYDPNSWQCWV
jgi:hypothetical protein